MNRILILLTLAVALAFGAGLAAHGGTYRGPGDTIPPGTGRPPMGTPDSPVTPTEPISPPTPGRPPAPGQPVTPPGVTPIPIPGVQPPSVTPPSPPGDDLNRWVFWWEFNKEPFLNLKAKVHAPGTLTGDLILTPGLGAYTSQNRTFKPTIQQITAEVIPALRRVLQEEDNRDIQSSCLVALAKVGLDPTVIELIRPRLSHGNQEIAETAALALGILQDPVVLPDLRALALDTEEGRKLTRSPNGVSTRTRSFAVYGLGLLAYASPDPRIRQEIAQTLWGLLSTDQSALSDLRVSAAVSLGLTRLEDPEPMVQQLAVLMADPKQDRLVRAHCPNAMAKLLLASASQDQADRWSAQLLALVAPKAKTPFHLRQSVVQSVGLLSRRCSEGAQIRIGEELMRLAEDGGDRQEKNLTAISIAYVGSSLKSGHPMQQELIAFLIKQMRKGSSLYRPWAGLGLGVMAHHLEEAGKPALPGLVGDAVLAAFDKEKSPSPKAAYAISLGLIGHRAGTESVVKVMQTWRQADLQGYCAVSLGLLGAVEHSEAIQEIVWESRRRPQLLQQAAIGLGLMGDHAVNDILLKLMGPDEMGRGPRLAVLSSVATAIGFIGDHRSVSPLVAMLESDRGTSLGRAFSAVALGLVVDKELLPWNSKIAEDLNYRAAVSTLVDQSTGLGVLDIL